MKNLFWILLACYGLYYYASKHFEFDDTLKYAKTNKQSTMSAPIDYYVGMVYYQRTEYAKARDAFNQLLEDHPTDQRVPRALVMLDDSAEYLHDWDTAKVSLQRYVDEYPSGKDIELVKKRLELVKYSHP